MWICNWILKFKDGVRYYIGFPKAVLFIIGLILSQSLVDYALVSILITYLTEDSNMKLQLAVMAIVIQDLLKENILILVYHITDAILGRFKVILYCSAIYTLGLVLLMVQLYRNVDLWLFFVAMVPISVGGSGLKYPLEAFVFDQLKFVDENDEERATSRKKVWWNSAKLLGIIVAILFFSGLGWKKTTLFSAILLGVSGVIFFVGSFLIPYKCHEPYKESPLILLFRVFLAAILKSHLNDPQNSNQPNETIGDPSAFHKKCILCRWLEKGTIIESSSLSSLEQESNWRLCTVEQVEETKSILRTVPMWTTFLIYGLGKSAGNTFFVEQGNQMNSDIGFIIEVPIFFLYMLQSLASFLSSYLYEFLLNKSSKQLQKYRLPIRIGIGMFCLIFCFSIAWRVETQRLHVVQENKILEETLRSKGVTDYKTTEMSILWLVPQFCLLGITKGLAEDGLDDFVRDRIPTKMENYVSPFNNIVVSIGGLFSIISIYASGTWFHDTINESRLDKYYRMLTIFCLGNWGLYCYISSNYTYEEVVGVGKLKISVELDKANDVEWNAGINTQDMQLKPIDEEGTEDMAQETINGERMQELKPVTAVVSTVNENKTLRKRESFKRPSV